MTPPLAVAAHHLRRQFALDGGGTVTALDGVDLQIQAGEIVAIVGRSGAGKSTLLNLIGAIDRSYEGELAVFGQELRKLSERELARFRNRQIGFVFQSFNLLPGLSVGDNVMLPASFGAEMPDSLVRTRAHHLLDEVGLGDRFNQPPMQLSGGERQRVAIARALLLEPPLLVCDEPTGSLDTATADQILQLFQDIRQKRGTTLVLVTHDPAVAKSADRLVRLDRGCIVGTTLEAA